MDVVHFFSTDCTPVVQEVCWHTSDGSHSLVSVSSSKAVVVLVELCVSLFEERHPPSSSIRSPGGPRSESTAPVSAWESVIDVNANPSIFDVEFESEDTIRIVRILTHDSLNSRSFL